jgi:hypothetical protein
MFEAKNNNQLERDVDVIESNVDRENVHQTQQHTFSLYDPFANTIEYNQKLQEFNQILKEAFRTETWGQKIRNSQSKLQNFLEDPSSSLAVRSFLVLHLMARRVWFVTVSYLS